jgi:hypothetical protein
MATNSPAGNGPVDRRVGRLLLRCPKCGRSQDTDRQKHDYQEAVRLEIVCPKCDDGDFHEPFYYDAQGKHIFRDPDEPPNDQIHGRR